MHRLDQGSSLNLDNFLPLHDWMSVDLQQLKSNDSDLSGYTSYTEVPNVSGLLEFSLCCHRAEKHHLRLSCEESLKLSLQSFSFEAQAVHCQSSPLIFFAKEKPVV